jgi:hypothetical protein
MPQMYWRMEGRALFRSMQRPTNYRRRTIEAGVVISLAKDINLNTIKPTDIK